MKIDMETKLDFDDVLIVPQRTKAVSRANINLQRTFSFYHSSQCWSGVPIFAANMDTTGSLSMSNALMEFDMPTCLHKHYSKETIDEQLIDCNYQWYSMGIKPNDIQSLMDFIEYTGEIPNICIDVANGYTDEFVNFCKKIRDLVGKSTIIMAGNVCTPEMVQELILHGGVDIVKVGIGPGSACTTRLKTGIGYPQLSAIIECSHAAHGLRNGERKLGLICADGGCRIPADVCKAFAAGADFVMLGGMLAGTHECEGDWEYTWDQRGHKMQKTNLKFYGMSSHEAQKKYGGIKDYRSSEGRVMTIPYKGYAKTVVSDILGGIRSACAYTGAACLKDFPKTAKFITVNRTHYNNTI